MEHSSLGLFPDSLPVAVFGQAAPVKGEATLTPYIA